MNKDSLNKMLGDTVDGLEEEAARKIENGDDIGHEKLLHDIEMLLDDAKTGQFHDFHKSGLDMPKMGLMHRLQKLIDNTKDGRYDN